MFFRKWACYYKVRNIITTSFQSLQNREGFFFRFDSKKQYWASDSPTSSDLWMSQFSSFQQPFLACISVSCQRLSWERNEPCFICFPPSGSYNTKLQSFSASPLLEIGYYISLRMVQLPGNIRFMSFHTCTHDKNCESVEFYSYIVHR